jgi:formylmethanofuran dehydrogenase subunit E
MPIPEISFAMDDNDEQTDPQVECPACHLLVFERGMTFVFGRRLCLACAGAWFEDEDEDD